MATAKLKFTQLQDVRAYVQQITADNHTATRKWTAAQNFYHLAAAFEGSLEALPAGYPRLVRLMVRPFRWVVIRFRFPPLLPIPNSARSKLEPPADTVFSVQQNHLLQAIEQFESFSGTHPPHPVLGELSRAEWTGFHLRHCAHHLRFLVLHRPEPSGT